MSKEKLILRSCRFLGTFLLLFLLLFQMGRPIQAEKRQNAIYREFGEDSRALPEADRGEERLQTLFARVAPAVLSLQIFEVRGSRKLYLRSISAFLISGDGLVLTAADGLEEALDHDGNLRSDRALYALLYQEKTFREIRLIRYSRSGDIAQLRLQNLKGRLPYLKSGYIPDPEIGEKVLCVAPPLDGAESGGIAYGVVSEIGRVWRSEHDIPRQNVRCTALFPQSYSGAPIINADGQLIGIATLNSERKYSDSSAYFHPLKVTKEALRLTEAQRKPRLSLGLSFLNNLSAAASCRLYNLPSGLWISAVAQDSPAYVGKLKAGDILLDANGRSMTSTADFAALMGELRFGQELILGVYRRESGEREEISLYPERYLRNLY